MADEGKQFASNFGFDPYEEGTEKDKRRNEFIASIQEVWNNWPDQVALYSNMYNQVLESGWEEMAARAITLNSILGGQAIFVIANVKNIEESTDND